MPNKYVNKVVIGKETKLDLTADTVTPDKLVPTNIREGVTVLGVKGSMSGSEGMKPQAKSVTPTFEQQVVLPDKAYNCLSQVTVAAIPATYVDNAAGGQTLTIGG